VHDLGECLGQRQPDPGSLDFGLAGAETLEGNENALDAESGAREPTALAGQPGHRADAEQRDAVRSGIGI